MEPVSATALCVLLWRRFLVFELDVETVGEPFDRACKVELLGLAHERDQIALGAASEAVVELVRSIDGEARRTLLVERAAAHVARPGLAELRASGHDRDDVRRGPDLFDGGVLDACHQV